jgi:hypothetical protein
MAEETRGRPTVRTEAVIEEVLTRLESGEPLLTICKADHLPEARTIYYWLDEDPAFFSRYQRAREIGYDQIAITARETTRGAGDSSGDVQRDKLIVETDLKLLAVWSPKRYGNRQIVSGDKDADPVQVEAKTDYSRLSVEELRTLMSLAEKASIARD